VVVNARLRTLHGEKILQLDESCCRVVQPTMSSNTDEGGTIIDVTVAIRRIRSLSHFELCNILLKGLRRRIHPLLKS
jgi:hypothetical protein